MSYKLFDQGYTAEEIKLMKNNQQAEDATMVQLRKWRESEHVLSMLRTIKASHEALTQMELEIWRKATKQRSLPVSL